ncbi:hypothetical protein ES702_03584 [subsurface metagenome]
MQSMECNEMQVILLLRTMESCRCVINRPNRPIQTMRYHIVQNRDWFSSIVVDLGEILWDEV